MENLYIFIGFTTITFYLSIVNAAPIFREKTKLDSAKVTMDSKDINLDSAAIPTLNRDDLKSDSASIPAINKDDLKLDSASIPTLNRDDLKLDSVMLTKARVDSSTQNSQHRVEDELMSAVKKLANERKTRVKRWGANWIALTLYDERPEARHRHHGRGKPQTPSNYDYDIGGGVWG